MNYVDGIIAGLSEEIKIPRLKMNNKNARAKPNRKEFKGTENLNEIKSMMTNDVQDSCEGIKKMMKEKGLDPCQGLDKSIKKEIVKLVIKVGHPKPIALMLGLNERVIIGWKDLYAKNFDQDPDQLLDDVYV